MDLSIVIPSFNGERLLPELLSDIGRALGSGLSWEVIVADDASTDSSVPLIRGGYPWVKLIEGKENLGFGGNCNRGGEASRGEFLAFVNTDIRFDSDPFLPLIEALASDASLFALMPLIFAEGLNRIENLNRIWKRRGLVWLRPRLDLPLSHVPEVQSALERQAVVPAPLCGAFFVCRRGLFDELGGFAREFGPAYWEDVDLGLRAEAGQYGVAVVPRILVRHLHSRTMDTALGDRRKRSLLLRNQALLIERHLDRLAPLPWYRWYLALRLPQRILAGELATAASYWRLICGCRRKRSYARM